MTAIVPATFSATINTEVGRYLRSQGHEPLMCHWALVISAVEPDGTVNQGQISSCPDPQVAAVLLTAGAERIGGGRS